MDPPRHTIARKIIGRSFSETMKRQPPDMMSIAKRLLAVHRERVSRGEPGALDVLHDFGTPYSVAVLCQLLGIPEKDESNLKNWSEWFFYLFTTIPSEEVRCRLDRALVEFRAYFAQELDQRRADPGSDLISAMMHAEFAESRLCDAELIDTCMLLFADGVENVDRCIASTVALLLAHPDQLRLMREEPEFVSQAVEESLRFESPAQFVGRIALEDLVIGETSIRKNSSVLLMLGSANRDPEQFDAPDCFDIRRPQGTQLSFGRGRHSCIGGPLVRLEVEVAIRELFASLPELALENEHLRWSPRLGHRWLAELPVTY